MACSVLQLSGEDVFDIHWIQRNINKQVIDHGRPDLTLDGDAIERVLFGGQLINRFNSDSLLGEYWCQLVNLTTSGVPVYLGASRMVTIREPEYYKGMTTCSDVVSSTDRKCGDALAPSDILIHSIVPSSSSTILFGLPSTVIAVPSTSAIPTPNGDEGEVSRNTSNRLLLLIVTVTAFAMLIAVVILLLVLVALLRHRTKHACGEYRA